MKKYLVLITLLISLNANAEKYILDPNHTNIDWRANHFGFSNPSGKFIESGGFILFDEKDVAKSSVEVEVKTASLITGLAKFDTHLKSEDFLNAKQFPVAKFVSNKIVKTGKNTAKIFGELTLLGVSKPVVLNAKLNKVGINPASQKKTIGISASTIIKRSDFGIKYALPAVSDEVQIAIEVEGNLE
jgi:polyisoprenoid-binding protein YceI